MRAELVWGRIDLSPSQYYIHVECVSLRLHEWHEHRHPHLNLTRKKNTLYTILERRYATPMFLYSPRPEVFVYRGLNISIANLVWGIDKKY